MDVDIKQGRLKRVRRNGLVNGVNPQQSLSWIYTLFDIVIAYMFAFEFEYTGMKEFQLILLTVIVTCIIYSCLKTTLIDPTDSIVKEEKLSKLHGQNSIIYIYYQSKNQFFQNLSQKQSLLLNLTLNFGSIDLQTILLHFAIQLIVICYIITNRQKQTNRDSVFLFQNQVFLEEQQECDQYQ